MLTNKKVIFTDLDTGKEIFSTQDWVRAEFLKSQAEGEFVDQFCLEAKINFNASLKQFSERTNIKIELIIKGIKQTLDKGYVSQYSVRPTRDDKALVEKITFNGILLDPTPEI